MKLVDKSFFEREAVELARGLLRCVLRCGDVAGRIVEVEAYLALDDGAAHSVRGVRDAVAALEKGPGTLYVHPMRRNVGMDVVAGRRVGITKSTELELQVVARGSRFLPAKFKGLLVRALIALLV